MYTLNFPEPVQDAICPLIASPIKRAVADQQVAAIEQNFPKGIECEIDLRPGGMFRTVMQSPEGQKFPNLGCYLEVIENQKLVWTNALLPGFRPAVLPPNAVETGEFFFTATIQLATHGTGTHYTATVRHADEAGCQKHAAMGFQNGWGKALDQLIEHSKKM